ncbi:hypothetical protein Prudu_018414 [Prunus dulcis]|uniref:EGF-like domain-containing protein n=1 Tax=Prunus dulcis TaxID=3755 RepID=A0A4Y1RQQ5_PRUDU|nr:hypothetical protein Prudu_018414 [Prunus dulcis]
MGNTQTKQMAFSKSIAFFAALLVLLPMAALASDWDIAPSIAAEVCKEVECGRGTCKFDVEDPLGFTCECEAGWKRTRDGDDDLKFLPCVHLTTAASQLHLQFLLKNFHTTCRPLTLATGFTVEKAHFNPTVKALELRLLNQLLQTIIKVPDLDTTIIRVGYLVFARKVAVDDYGYGLCGFIIHEFDILQIYTLTYTEMVVPTETR